MNKTDIELTREKLVHKKDRLLKPDSLFIPKLTFFEQTKAVITTNERNKRISKKVTKKAKKFRDKYKW